MLTISTFAKKLGVSRQRVHQLLLQRRVPGAKHIGRGPGLPGFWIIPQDAKVSPPK